MLRGGGGHVLVRVDPRVGAEEWKNELSAIAGVGYLGGENACEKWNSEQNTSTGNKHTM